MMVTGLDYTRRIVQSNGVGVVTVGREHLGCGVTADPPGPAGLRREGDDRRVPLHFEEWLPAVVVEVDAFGCISAVVGARSYKLNLDALRSPKGSASRLALVFSTVPAIFVVSSDRDSQGDECAGERSNSADPGTGGALECDSAPIHEATDGDQHRDNSDSN